LNRHIVLTALAFDAVALLNEMDELGFHLLASLGTGGVKVIGLVAVLGHVVELKGV